MSAITREQLAEALRIAQGTARKYAARIPHADGHAEDAAQDAVAEVLREAHRWTPDRGAWGAWVGTVVARVVRRSLRVDRAPVSGNQWRAHIWAVTLRSVPDDALADAPAHDDAVGEVFAHEVRGALINACSHVPHAELGLAALLEHDTSRRLALRAGVAKLTVERAARAVREALEDSADLGAFWTEQTMTTTKTDPQVTRMYTRGFMPATEAAERAGYDISHIYRLIKGDAPKVEGFRIGERAWYVKRASLVAYLGEQGAKALGLDKLLPGEAPAAPEVDPDDLVPATEHS